MDKNDCIKSASLSCGHQKEGTSDKLQACLQCSRTHLTDGWALDAFDNEG
jgi:hypothetical protein